MTDQPLVSVILPLWNGRRFLAEALASIEAQEFRDFEIVAVDDGSTDGCGDLARAVASVFIAHDVPSGVAASRNEAVRASRGAILALLDQDDTWDPPVLSLHVAALGRDPLAISVLQGVEVVEPGALVPEWFRRRELLEGPHPMLIPSGIAFRRETFDRLGPFDESLTYASDFDWLARARAAGVGFSVSDAVAVRRRLHEANDSRHAQSREELYQVVRAGLARRRQGERA